MKIPKIEFKVMTLEENIETIKWAYYENNGVLSVHSYTIQYFPELANIDKSMSISELIKSNNISGNLKINSNLYKYFE